MPIGVKPEALSKIRHLSSVSPLLLYSLSQLRQLSIAASPEHWAQMKDVLSPDEDSHNPYMRHLKQVTLASDPYGTEGSFDAVKSFASFDTVTRLTVSNILEETYGTYAVDFLSSPTHLEEVTFHSSVIRDKTMYAFLQGCPRLKRLTWEEMKSTTPRGRPQQLDTSWHEGATRGYTNSFTLCAMLIANNKDTLEELRITTAFERAHIFMGDISRLSSLKLLDVYKNALVESNFSQEAILPVSLEELTIDCGATVGDFLDATT